MNNSVLLVSLGGVLASAAPILFAVIGETISERAGVLNLSMNGLILIAAMGSFAVALATNSVVLGFVAGAAIGGGKCIIFIWVAMLVVTILCNTKIGQEGLRLIRGDTVLNFLYDKNIFIRIFAGINRILQT